MGVFFLKKTNKHGTELPKWQGDTFKSRPLLSLVRGSQRGPGENLRAEGLRSVPSLHSLSVSQKGSTACLSVVDGLIMFRENHGKLPFLWVKVVECWPPHRVQPISNKTFGQYSF